MAVGRYNFFFSIFIVILLRVLSFSVQRSQYELWNDPCIDFNHITSQRMYGVGSVHLFLGVNNVFNTKDITLIGLQQLRVFLKEAF